MPDNDPVKSPNHYTALGATCSQCGHPIECKDITMHMNNPLGNVLKYAWRAPYSKHQMQDLLKAREYIDIEIDRRERHERLVRSAAMPVLSPAPYGREAPALPVRDLSERDLARLRARPPGYLFTQDEILAMRAQDVAKGFGTFEEFTRKGLSERGRELLQRKPISQLSEEELRAMNLPVEVTATEVERGPEDPEIVGETVPLHDDERRDEIEPPIENEEQVVLKPWTPEGSAGHDARIEDYLKNRPKGE